MKKKLAALAVVCALYGAGTAPSAHAAPIGPEVIGVETRTLQVKYQSGAAEKYVVKWTGIVSGEWREDGHPAIPLKGWFVDTRQCFWTINFFVTRQVFLANQNGELFEKKDLATPLSARLENKGSDLKIINGFRPENCNDARDRRESDINNARVHVRQSLPAVAKNDLSAVFASLKSGGNVRVALGK